MKPSVAVVIVGIDKWEEYTKPLIDSIQEYAPDYKIYLVDNASETPYPTGKGVKLIRVEKRISYAAALNMGMIYPHDWYIITNNDVLWHNRPPIEACTPFSIYGFKYHDVNDRDFLSSWCMFISRKATDEVGLFDEDFAPMYWEDADYCFRAEDKGFDLVELNRRDWGIEHLQRYEERGRLLKEWEDVRKKNLVLLKGKHDL